MLLRNLSAPQADDVQPAFDAFRNVQRSPGIPCGILLQSEHSRLAGAIADSLLPEVFGPLDQHVISAIWHHDDGWNSSDGQQIDTIQKHPPRPFTTLSAEDTLPSWIGSIANGRVLGPLQEVLISRHCCLLGTGSSKHAKFVENETERRTQLERALPYSSEDLDRWTAALGFCDLLSLYLCSGSETPVELPLAHPDARGKAPAVMLHWVAGRPQLSRPLLQPGAQFHADAMLYRGGACPMEPLPLEWSFLEL